MFTGIVEALGTVVEVEDGDRLRRIQVETPDDFLQGARTGDSIAVDGACLTALEPDGGAFRAEVIRSTLVRSVAAGYRPGSRVNLERALAMGDRLEGHIVQGHVDGIGHLIRILEEGETRLMEVRVPRAVHAATILHGSIALNGVSLTVNALREPDLLEVALIPHTWTRTNLSLLSPGDRLNVEGDLIGKYVGRLLGGSSRRGAGEGPRDEEM
jgi:riboflavin synthase